MKFENNNKEVIRRLTNRSLRTNKIRNIFAIFAIVLTTFMISSVFSIGVSFVKNYKTMNIRLSGTTANASLANPTAEQIEKLQTLDIFKSTGFQINVGEVDLDTLSENKTSIGIQYYDKDNFDKQLSPALGNIDGRYPASRNEIMISRLALEFLSKGDAKLGDKINIPCRINDEVINEEFIISGIFDSYGLTRDTGYIYVSMEFIKANNLTVEEKGSILMTIKESSRNTADDILNSNISLKDNQKFEYMYVVEDQSSTEIGVAMLVMIMVTFIVLSGYLLIYNVLYIAVTKDINFYGLLKTIGTSSKQIKKIVKGQALKLSIIGIPIGLILGAIVSFGIVPAVMGIFFGGLQSAAMPHDVSFSPLIFILTALFSLITVAMSCRKPAKIAGNISPIEALRYTGSKPKKQKKNRNTTNGGKLYKMAWYNVFRGKKRTILVFVSLFMGIITFLSVSTFIDSIKVENYIDRYVPNDFELENAEAKEEKIDDTTLNDINNMNGVESLDVFKASTLRLTMNDEIVMPSLKEAYNKYGLNEDELNGFVENIKNHPEFMDASVIGIDDKIIESIYNSNDDKFDLEAFKNGSLVLMNNWYYGENYKDIKGDLNITNTNTNENQTYNTQVVGFKENIPNGIARPIGVPTIYMSNTALEKLDKNATNYVVYVNGDEKYEPQIKADLEKIEKNKGLLLDSKTTKTEEFNKTSMVQRVLGGGVSLILILIGILNFINVMITGVNIRLRELAIMESIGMTKKQIKKMLIFEGLYYAAIESILTCTVGVAIIYGISILARNVADYAVFSFPGIQLMILMILIFTICLITPELVFKVSSKQSIIERIREIEK